MATDNYRPICLNCTMYCTVIWGTSEVPHEGQHLGASHPEFFSASLMLRVLKPDLSQKEAEKLTIQRAASTSQNKPSLNISRSVDLRLLGFAIQISSDIKILHPNLDFSSSAKLRACDIPPHRQESRVIFGRLHHGQPLWPESTTEHRKFNAARSGEYCLASWQCLRNRSHPQLKPV